MRRFHLSGIALLLSLLLFLSGCTTTITISKPDEVTQSYTLSELPEYSGEPYVYLNNNVPAFSEDEMTDVSFETYSELDSLGRCGAAYASIGPDLMPTEKRSSIGMVKPSGWQTARYDCVDGKYLYNRCHLIGYQLTAENANPQNLITGTRYLNVSGMLPFEDETADYIRETGNHVLYRVTPIFDGSNLVANGVQMEAKSVEDNGKGVQFNVYCFNVQPFIFIDYTTGESCLLPEYEDRDTASPAKPTHVYILNVNSKKFHNPDCSGVKTIKAENKAESTQTRDALIRSGFSPCKTCKP